jgi:hypothetical protein
MRTTKRQTPPIERLAYSPGELAKAIGISKTYAYTLVREPDVVSDLNG